MARAAKKVTPHSASKTPDTLKKFARTFFEKVPADDLSLLRPEAQLYTAERHQDMSRKRKPGKPLVAIHTPPPDPNDPAMAGNTIIDIVSDDMPFLIDSISAEITRRGRLIHVLIHPVLHTKHDSKKTLQSVAAKPVNGSTPQSHIHIVLQGTIPDALIPDWKNSLLQVLSDVDYATRDWATMRQKVRACQKALNKAPQVYNENDIEEYIYFLEYLYKDNFTLLGYREYKFTENKGKLKSSVVKNSGLGLLHDDRQPVYLNIDDTTELPQNLQKFRRNLPPLSVSKVNRLSSVHRAVPLDAIAVKQFDKKGNVTGEHLLIGLFTSVTYSRSIQDIPLLRRKADEVLRLAKVKHDSHDFKALRHTLEKYPRDELFQIGTDDLLKTALSILRLQERQRIALYIRPDPFGRFVSCLVYVPRDRYETRLRLKIQKILEEELGGTCGNIYVGQDDSPLARLMIVVQTGKLKPPKYNVEKIEKRLQEAGQIWSEQLSAALFEHKGSKESIPDIVQKYGEAFPSGYRDAYRPKQAVHDIEHIEKTIETSRLRLDLYHCTVCSGDELRLKLYNCCDPVILSDILPILENMGLKILSERPFEIRPNNTNYSVWLYDFMMSAGTINNLSPHHVEEVKDKFEEALKRIWEGELENDALNRLILAAGMDWREILILRTCVRYLRQTGTSFSVSYIEQALNNNPEIARELVNTFKALHDPTDIEKGRIKAAGCAVAIDHALEKVESLDEDRILRNLITLINATLRTNFFQTDIHGKPKPYLSLKLDSTQISDLPDPKPYREIFVYSPRMEGIHLRGDVIARGGIRWSDRHEDFRTEVLGLMKAQQVKNSLIVPMGAKGGFIVKKPPVGGGRDAFLAEGIECYKTLVRGMLDITDNRKGKRIIPPQNVVRRDGDDPYLVVAADKGTATFSDIANGLSEEYEFWLGDAFASGGSAGYDHKVMGITARGAWESVKRHFRELNHNTQTDDFEVIGVGDMAGDVFGNGMLLSEHIKLVGAFNHLHIFCDPDPDPSVSFKERKRLFNNVKGWNEYDKKKLSKGGRIYERSEKNLELTPEIQKRFNIERERVTPAELMRAILLARTDLMWFGGIGTYIKASDETHADVGDKSNDALRINAADLQARVVGEGANLAMTQAARIEYALKGGKINADFIDNSGGVDSSDHEVNIKILLTDILSKSTHKMTLKKRNNLLERMTDEVADHVLRNNYQQTQAISLMEARAARYLPTHAQFIDDLDRKHGVDRNLEGLPNREEIEKRVQNGKGLTRPELGILQAWAKILLTQDLLAGSIPDDPAIMHWLFSYFPSPLRKPYEKEIKSHRLRRELTATIIATSVVNRMGPVFVKAMMDRTGESAENVVRAYMTVRRAFDLKGLWSQIEEMDGKVPAAVQTDVMQEIMRVARRETLWFLRRPGRSSNMARDVKAFGDGIKILRASLETNLPPLHLEAALQRAKGYESDGFPADLAHEIALIPAMGAACDIIQTATDMNVPIPAAAGVYFTIGAQFNLQWLRRHARFMHSDDKWTTEALNGVIDRMYSVQSLMASRILSHTKPAMLSKSPQEIVDSWLENRRTEADHLLELLADIRQSGTVDLPMLVVAVQRIRALCEG